MKRRDILISLAIIAAALVACYLVFQQEGNVEIVTPGVLLTLNRPFFGEMTLTSAQGPVRVPARAYFPRSLGLTAHANGSTWSLSSTGPWGDLARVKVKPGRTTSLAVGPPLRIVPKVDIGPYQAYIDLQIFGGAGERYRNVIVKDGRSLPAPELKIVNEEGSVLVTDKFQYG
ncbi:MAG: hypothetical protein JW993_19490 [Sedimentisphaerales bacterium]|nr:hypothetical protein [Sedimentisphaerales bacterium]